MSSEDDHNSLSALVACKRRRHKKDALRTVKDKHYPIPPVTSPIIKYDRYESVTIIERNWFEEGRWEVFERLAHSFGAPLKIQTPHPYDFVFAATAALVKHYNCSTEYGRSLQGYADPLRVEALSASPTLFYPGYSSSAVHLLTRHELFVKVQLALDYSSEVNAFCGTVVVLVDGVWEPFEAWLEKLPPSVLEVTGEGGNRLQYLWWKALRKPFRFWKLPERARELIVLHAIGPRVALHEQPGGNISLVDGKKLVYIHEHMRAKVKDYLLATSAQSIVRPTETAIFHANKAFRQLARDVLWKHTTKVFMGPHDLFPLAMTGLPSSRHGGFLRHLELTFTNVQYIEFFKAKLYPFNMGHDFLADWHTPSDLTSLPNLRSLTLFFRAVEPDAMTPWTSIAHVVRDQGVDLFPGPNYYRDPCQKLLVNQILVFAYEHLRKIPRVRIDGYVKTETKDKWARIFGSKGRVDPGPVVEAEKQAILDMPGDHFPPMCYCPRKCNLSTYNDIGCAEGFFRRTESEFFDRDDVLTATNPNVVGSASGLDLDDSW